LFCNHETWPGALQEEVDAKLKSLLTEEQNKKLSSSDMNAASTS